MSSKCDIKFNRKESKYTVKFELTDGELTALSNALKSYDTAVSADVSAFLSNALIRLADKDKK